MVTSAFRNTDGHDDHGFVGDEFPQSTIAKPSVSKPDSPAKYSGTRRSLLELLDDGGAERREIGRRPAGDQIPIDDYLLVDDVTAGLSKVGADARVRSHRSPRHHVRLHEGPRPMADGGDWLAGIHEVPHERHRRTIQSKLVRIHRAPGQNEGVELVDGCLRYGPIDCECSRRLQVMVACLYVIGFQRQQLNLAAVLSP